MGYLAENMLPSVYLRIWEIHFIGLNVERHKEHEHIDYINYDLQRLRLRLLAIEDEEDVIEALMI